MWSKVSSIRILLKLAETSTGSSSIGFQRNLHRCSKMSIPAISVSGFPQEVTLSPKSILSYVSFSPEHTSESAKSFAKSFRLITDFITETEEDQLFKEAEPHLKRLPYEKDHWDEAIIGFRETERKTWNKSNAPVIQRLRDASFDPDCRQLPYVHVLDLAEDGYIKPHIDSVRVRTVLHRAHLERLRDQERSCFFSSAEIRWPSSVYSQIASSN